MLCKRQKDPSSSDKGPCVENLGTLENVRRGKEQYAQKGRSINHLLGGVHKDVTLVELLDILLDLCKSSLVLLLPAGLSDGVELCDMCCCLVIGVNLLPLGLKTVNQSVLLLLAELTNLAVPLVVLLLLQPTDVFVLLLDITLNLLQVVGGLTVISLVQVVLNLLTNLLGCSQDVLDSVGGDEILAADKVHDRALITPWDRWLRASLNVLGGKGVWVLLLDACKGWDTLLLGLLLQDLIRIRMEGTRLLTESGVTLLVVVVGRIARERVLITTHILHARKTGLRTAEGRGSWGKVSCEFALVHWELWDRLHLWGKDLVDGLLNNWLVHTEHS